MSAAKVVVYSYLGVILSCFINFISVPISLHYFGVELYGLIALVVDLLVYAGLLNFGVPWTIATIFAQSRSITNQRDLINKATKILFIVSLCALLLLILINFYYPNYLNSIISLSYKAKHTGSLFVNFSIMFFFIKLPLSIYNQLLIFMHKTHLAKFIDVLNALSNFIAIIIVVYFKLSLPILAIICGILTLATSIFSLFLFKNLWQNNNEEFYLEDLISYKVILQRSYYYFVSSFGLLIIWNTDNLIINSYLGLKEVAIYAVTFKLFSVLYFIVTQIINVVNPIYAKLFGQNKLEQLVKIYNLTSIALTLIGGIVLIFLLLFAQDFILLWTNIKVDRLNILFLGLYCYFLCASLNMYSILATLNLSQKIYKLILLEATVNIVLSIALVRYLGIAGVSLASLIAHLIVRFILIPLKINNYQINYSFILKHLTFISPIVIIGFLIEYNYNLSIATKILVLLISYINYIFVCYLIIGRDLRYLFKNKIFNKL